MRHGIHHPRISAARLAYASPQAAVTAGGTIATIRNIDAIRTAGLKLALQNSDLVVKGFDLSSSLNNKRYWAFHPYPQRTFHAEVGFDL